MRFYEFKSSPTKPLTPAQSNQGAQNKTLFTLVAKDNEQSPLDHRRSCHKAMRP